MAEEEQLMESCLQFIHKITWLNTVVIKKLENNATGGIEIPSLSCLHSMFLVFLKSRNGVKIFTFT